MLALGSLSSLGYGPLAGVTILGMQFLDFFDFLTNSVMMPIAAIATCLLVSRVVGVDAIEQEVTLEGGTFRRKKIFCVMIRYICPIFAVIILLSSVGECLRTDFHVSKDEKDLRSRRFRERRLLRNGSGRNIFQGD